MKSKLFTLDLTDAQKAVVVAALSVGGTAIARVIETALTAGRFPTSIEMFTALKVGAIATGSYLLKNFFTNSEDKVMKKELKK